jgi:hypothetical protein
MRVVMHLPPGRLTFHDLRGFPRFAGAIPSELRCQCCGSRAITVLDISGAGGVDPIAIACKEVTCGRAITGPSIEKASWFFNRPLKSEAELDAASLRHASLTCAREAT